MPPKNPDGGRSTVNSQRSLFAREKNPNLPSGGTTIDLGNKDVQDALFQKRPPSGGDVITESNADFDQHQDIPSWPETDDQPVRGGSANPTLVSHETNPGPPRHRVVHSPQVHADPRPEPSATFNGAHGTEPSPPQSEAPEPLLSRFPVQPPMNNLTIQGPLHPWKQQPAHGTPWQQQLGASTLRPNAQQTKTFNLLRTPEQTRPMVQAQPDRSRLSLSFHKKQTAQRNKDTLREQEQHRLARGHIDKQ